jgi:hypothetical protein
MSWLSYSLSALTVLGAFWIALADKKSSKAAKIVAAIIVLSSIMALAKNIQAERAQAAFEREMRVKAEETLRQVTGGEGFTEVSLSGLNPSSSEALLAISNGGDYPLYDVSLSIIDLEMQHELERRGVPPSESFFSVMNNLGPFNIGPHQTKLIKNWKLHGSQSLSYAINVTGRNGAWFQALRYRLIGDKWVRATSVKRNNDVLLHEIEDGYPLDGTGEPKW